MKKSFRILKFKKDRPILEIKDVSKSFDGRPILKKISMKVFPSEIVGILGPNGCGKSTLFESICGIQSFDAGKIFLNSKSIEQIPIHLRSKEGLGYFPQQRSVFNMSVFNNIMGLAQETIKGSEHQRETTEKLLEEFNLGHLRSINATMLSGGEVKRLQLARLMLNNPKIVLLDEPLSALDPLVIEDVSKYILKIQAKGVSILMSEHNVKNLFALTDRNYVLGEQSIIAEGTSRDLLKSSKAREIYFGSEF